MKYRPSGVAATAWFGRLAGVGLALAGLLSWPAAAASMPRAACDANTSATVVHALPSNPGLPASAYWLTGDVVQWPGVSSAGRFKLYHSQAGQVAAAAGAPVLGADGALLLAVATGDLGLEVSARFKHVGQGVRLTLAPAEWASMTTLHTGQLVLVQEDEQGRVVQATHLQAAGALDALFGQAARDSDLGVAVTASETRFTLWAPTAQAVAVCRYASGTSPALAMTPMRRDQRTGIWSLDAAGRFTGQYYTYLVDVFVPGVGLVRNRVTDPYSVSLTTDSRRSLVADLDDRALKPAGWDHAVRPKPLASQTDMVIYELHVRDFSINDASVPSVHRGKYLAFAQARSNGMRHLRALAKAGLTDVHLLPVFDLASIPEAGCVSPSIEGGPDAPTQQAAVMPHAARDCFNWGYDPLHFNAPEGSYASNAANGATRVRELRRMVMALHQAGLRVGMDVVYNHTSASGQKPQSVLDRIVPGYYHRLNAKGEVEQSTCCDNTATEHLMMAKLMSDSVLLWTRHYAIDSFRFDLMGHQPKAAMLDLKAGLRRAAGREIQLIGEGWNFGEVADGARFEQASQLSLGGTGIGTFSDRARDAVRGGGPSDHGAALIQAQGYINGLVYDPNAQADGKRPAADLPRAADLVRVGLAGSIRDYALTTHDGTRKRLHELDYNGQSAGYVREPAEVVNYVENHDNQTLFDINAFKLPATTSREDRARVQMLGAAINMFSQGVAYFHAGIDTLRSKSLDRNSFDSGDWFNRLDWTYTDNYFATGLPLEQDNGKDWALMRPILTNPLIKPTPREIAWTRDQFRDLLKIRASSTLFRLRSAQDIAQRLTFHNTGPTQNPVLLAAHLDGRGYAGAKFAELLYLVNVDKVPHQLLIAPEQGKRYVLHPVHLAPGVADKRVAAQARYEPSTGGFTVPARTALVFVVH
ncbi:alpha-1,6-glucosidase domain-containing protein [Rhodoferax sp.]|uniref:alpha-1,6-glucosidase domain-containing protein n=1 Tax=Rhodoferax sp. TaxID=50421 RepID=UPI002765DDB9|nr:DUF3372 domain-containing protein [Rhodoferax sp.]